MIASKKDPPIDGSEIETVTELADAIVEVLNHEISDDSFDHAFGTEHRSHVEIHPDEVQVWYPSESETIPMACDIHYQAGGCDGEHRGKCQPCCAEVDVELQARLLSLNWTNSGVIAQYAIDHP